ncbi:Fe-S cluster assembly sulfur transfer protein SufU [Microbacterium sp. CJ88]|uniref:Fe-S cluster assembly sulfur transfer protein SufU n=1 Tax=Microbacterium sp. CJ88 TaxID=3445672 RepID=UPI003F657D97
MSELEDLYREVILDHSRRPIGRGDVSTAAHTHHELNPSCGDEITVGVTVTDGRLDPIVWEGQGCSISMASASVMTSILRGMPRAEASALIDEYRAMLRSRGGEFEPSDELGDAAAFQGVAKYVMRVKCAMLAWVALEAALLQEPAAG